MKANEATKIPSLFLTYYPTPSQNIFLSSLGGTAKLPTVIAAEMCGAVVAHDESDFGHGIRFIC